jgi:peptidoglycan hydrolase-like protein with peptidoglycan-binding domain
MKTYVSKWTTALAVIVGGALLATSAIAQSSAGTSPAKSSADTTKSDAPKADMTKSTAPQADTSKSDAPKADSSSKSPGATTGSAAGEMKSDAMKSGQPKDSAQSGDREQVKAVQQALKDKGFDPGEVDGAMGPKTQAALRDYQQKEGLKATGNADAETMAKLTASASMPAASPKDATSPAAKPTK